MEAKEVRKTWSDPYALVREATSYHAADGGSLSSARSTVKDAIRRAHQLVSPDLYIIERLKQSHVEPDYISLFGEQTHEKLAALIFLTKHKLLDIEQSALDSRDIDDARRDLTSFVEVIFHLKAIDALAAFYDFAAAQRVSRVPRLWRNVCARCLYLMSLLKECREKTLTFLQDHPDARQLMNELQASTAPEIASALRELLQQSAQTAVPAETRQQPMPLPSYVALVQQYEAQAPTTAGRDATARGVSSLLSAQDRITQAAAAGDVAGLLDWINNGSPAAMHTVFRCAIACMSSQQYIAMLEQSLTRGTLDPVRMTAVVLELGSLNRGTHPAGGMPAVNRILQRVALNTDTAFAGVAKVTVHELASVRATGDLHTIMETAPVLEVAAEVIQVLRELRILPVVETLLNQRPELIPALRAARKELLELQDLVDTVQSCQSEELALIYLEELKAYKAIPEIKQLAMMPGFISEAARRMLSELQADIPWAQAA